MTAHLTRAEVEFGVLGPLVVRVRGREIELPGVKERSLLAFLLLRANETVSAEMLIDALWPDDPPTTARNALQVRISHVRKVFEPGRIATAPNGYSLRVAADELDLFCFRELVLEARRDREDGEPVLAAEKLNEALELWRGGLLPEFIDNPAFRAEIGGLEDERLSALEERIQAELDLGRGAELVSELESAVAASPLRERLMGQLMVALYRAGRQVEALEAYGQVRRRLVDELGIEPGPLLSALHHRILAQDAALIPAQPSAPRPAAAPSRRNLTIVLAALSMSDDDPEVAGRKLGEDRSLVSAALEAHGAAVRVLGDTVVGSFGLPAAHEDDPLRALRAASELSLEGGLRLAVETGVVLASDQELVDDRVVGRLGQLVEAAADGEVILGAGARRVLGDAAELVESRTPGAWRLVGFDPSAEPITRRLDAPLIGREEEFKRLRDAFGWVVRTGSCHLVTILGPAGIGKSRLTRELYTSVSDDATVLTGRCLAYGSGAFWPLSEMVKQAAGDTRPPALERILEGLPDRRLVVDQLAAALGTGGSLRAEDAFWAFRKLFVTIAAERPLVLIF